MVPWLSQGYIDIGTYQKSIIDTPKKTFYVLYNLLKYPCVQFIDMEFNNYINNS